MNGQSVPQRLSNAWDVELSAIRRAKVLASRESGYRVAHSRQVIRCHPMETLEHLDADSETDAISDIQPVQNVTPNVRHDICHSCECSTPNALCSVVVLNENEHRVRVNAVVTTTILLRFEAIRLPLDCCVRYYRIIRGWNRIEVEPTFWKQFKQPNRTEPPALRVLSHLYLQAVLCK